MRQQTMYALALFSLLFGLFELSAPAANAQVSHDFAQLKALAGEWEGRNSTGGARTLTLEIVSGGTAVQETLKDGDNETMITMYHLDGNRLRATHYCSVGNQPQLATRASNGKTSTDKASNGTTRMLHFHLVGVTNLTKPTAGHMQSLAINFQDADHFEQVWTYRESGKDIADTFKWTRRNGQSGSK